MSPLLEVRGLTVQFQSPTPSRPAVDGVSFTVEAGRTLALVGESGSGKSVTALSVMGLLPRNALRPGGEVLVGGQSILGAPDLILQRIRGSVVGMVFQEPMTSLNPVLTIGDQVAAPVRAHLGWTRQKAWAHAGEMLQRVGIPDAAARLHAYPHQLSGGMRQRVCVAAALSCGPKLLIADEPTTALDVTVQAQLMELLGTLQASMGMGMLLITHDLGLVAQHAQDVAVMYAGQVVEKAGVGQLLTSPAHPYAAALLASIPAHASGPPRTPLPSIPGQVPPLHSTPPGCRFAPRCAFASPRCTAEMPKLLSIGPGREVACHHPRHLAGLTPESTSAP